MRNFFFFFPPSSSTSPRVSLIFTRFPPCSLFAYLITYPITHICHYYYTNVGDRTDQIPHQIMSRQVERSYTFLTFKIFGMNNWLKEKRKRRKRKKRRKTETKEQFVVELKFETRNLRQGTKYATK